MGREIDKILETSIRRHKVIGRINYLLQSEMFQQLWIDLSDATKAKIEEAVTKEDLLWLVEIVETERRKDIRLMSHKALRRMARGLGIVNYSRLSNHVLAQQVELALLKRGNHGKD